MEVASESRTQRTQISFTISMLQDTENHLSALSGQCFMEVRVESGTQRTELCFTNTPI